MSGFENTITHDAHLRSIDPTEQLVANGELQRARIVEAGGFGAQIDISLASLDPIQQGVVGMSVSKGSVELMSVIEVGNKKIGIIDIKRDACYGRGYELDAHRFILADLHVAPDEQRRPVFSVSKSEQTGHVGAVFIKEPDTTSIFGSGQNSRIFEVMALKNLDPDSVEDQLRFRLNEGGILHIEGAGNGVDVSVLVRPSNDQERTLNPDEIQQMREMTGMNEEGIIDHVPDFSKTKRPRLKAKTDTNIERIEPFEEFMLGDNKATYLGRVELKSNNGGFVFESKDDKGVTRRFFVYQSNSEGGWRVSQGIEEYEEDGKRKIRYIKGPENKPDKQYTQDTKLVSGLEDMVNKLQTQGDGELLPLWQSAVVVAEQNLDSVLDDFEDLITTTHELINSEDALRAITWLRAGNLVTKHLRGILGLPEDSKDSEVENAVLQQVEIVNKAILQEDIVPDLRVPLRTTYEVHPILGQITKDSFVKNIGEHNQEWVFAHDNSGRVWIDRIRYADSSVTPYGTDAEMIDSGFLTSKPLEYADQATAVPANLKSKASKGYSDITPFLDLFEPIKRYRNQREVSRT